MSTALLLSPASDVKKDRYWLIDYRIYDKQGRVNQLDLPRYASVESRFFDSVAWTLGMPANLFCESLDKMYYVPLKCNRLVDSQESKINDTLHWTDAEQH